MKTFRHRGHRAPTRRAQRPRILRFKSPVYPFTVVFYIGPQPTDGEFAAVCKRYKLWNGQGKLPTCGGGDAGACQFSSGTVVWLQELTFTPKGMSHLAHELVHVLNNLSETLGERQTFHNDELFAYFSGWLVGKLMERMERQRA